MTEFGNSVHYSIYIMFIYIVYISNQNPITFTTSTNYTFNHNIGTPPELVFLVPLARPSSQAMWSENALSDAGSFLQNGAYNINRTSAVFSVGTGGVRANISASASVAIGSIAAGQLAIRARRAF